MWSHWDLRVIVWFWEGLKSSVLPITVQWLLYKRTQQEASSPEVKIWYMEVFFSANVLFSIGTVCHRVLWMLFRLHRSRDISTTVQDMSLAYQALQCQTHCLRQPHAGTSSSISDSPILSPVTSSCSDSPLCTSITPSLFHSRLKTCWLPCL